MQIVTSQHLAKTQKKEKNVWSTFFIHFIFQGHKMAKLLNTNKKMNWTWKKCSNSSKTKLVGEYYLYLQLRNSLKSSCLCLYYIFKLGWGHYPNKYKISTTVYVSFWPMYEVRHSTSDSDFFAPVFLI